MELLQLRYFHEVAQTQHMTNSAKRLGVAQPALTQAIRRLESELNTKLFERAGRNIRLTPCGEALEAKVAPLLAAFDEIPLTIAQAKGQERDTVRIDVEAATSMTVDAIAVFRATVPQAAFVINQANSEARWDVRVRTAAASRMRAHPRCSANAYAWPSPRSRQRVSRFAWRISPMRRSCAWRERAGSAACATSCA